MTLLAVVPYMVALAAVSAEVTWIACRGGEPARRILRAAATAAPMAAGAVVVGAVYGVVLAAVWPITGALAPDALVDFLVGAADRRRHRRVRRLGSRWLDVSRDRSPHARGLGRPSTPSHRRRVRPHPRAPSDMVSRARPRHSSVGRRRRLRPARRDRLRGRLELLAGSRAHPGADPLSSMVCDACDDP